jgi:hypothetical protein
LESDTGCKARRMSFDVEPEEAWGRKKMWLSGWISEQRKPA